MVSIELETNFELFDNVGSFDTGNWAVCNVSLLADDKSEYSIVCLDLFVMLPIYVKQKYNNRLHGLLVPFKSLNFLDSFT